MLKFFICCSLLLLHPTEAFHSGAPVEACDSLLPRHLHTSPKPASESPFIFTASARHFYPDSKRRKIKVKIRGASFKGFFVVALDADTHERIGTFLDASGMEAVPCSAVTHTDGRPKIMATMLWQPPEDRKRGEVIFLATILESFSSYYTGQIATIRRLKTKKRLQRQTIECGGFSPCSNSTTVKNQTVEHFVNKIL
ncbi:putative ferric-chelate reductase 1 [Nephila pilipes]|uniref:Putative ferric-chelate reductase 1 n=1 Tax=Nephila pilipes TaxID=299642 RepID=A0A8X6P931_NEPPI|nr:putative ferric-chelate reductase 1 [Nephila pilipes]